MDNLMKIFTEESIPELFLSVVEGWKLGLNSRTPRYSFCDVRSAGATNTARVFHDKITSIAR